MHLALSALREEEVTVAGLASRLGYRSEAAFSRAFKRVIGVSPGAVRRQRRLTSESLPSKRSPTYHRTPSSAYDGRLAPILG
jgi:AraC-like DNA-binding protein